MGYRGQLEARLSNRNLDFSLVGDEKIPDVVTFICPIHGRFRKTIRQLMKGCGCPACDAAFKSGFKTQGGSSAESFVAKASYIHNGYYDYSKAVYTSRNDDVCIICPEHGEFWQKPVNHLAGQGCRQCRNRRIGDALRKPSDDFVRQALEVHGQTYDYTKVDYVNGHTPVCIICPKHGEFWQNPSGHLSGKGCPDCAVEKVAAAHTQTPEEMLDRFRQVHGDFYDYGKAVFGTALTPITITCPVHGDFQQTPSLHYKGSGCPECAKNSAASVRRGSTDGFLSKARRIHGGAYNYRLVDYRNSKTPVKLVCGIHGVFEQRPNDHLGGHGCPTCAKVTRGRSNASEEFLAFIRSLAPDLECEKRLSESSKRRWRVDGYVPSANIGFEFNGLRWHSTKFQPDPAHHFKRFQSARSEGYRLVFIHEDEWKYRRSAVENLVTHLLGKSKRLFARKCKVGLVEPTDAKQFYERHHIQGCHIAPHISYGLFSDGILVACMSFSRKTSNRKTPYKDGRWELVRFASTASVVGGASKLFKHFIADYKPSEVVSYSMNHLFDGKVYEMLGFVQDGYVRMDYTYVDAKSIKRLHKSNFQHKRLAQRFENYDPNLTEEQNCANNNFYRIYDCGKKRWLWKL